MTAKQFVGPTALATFCCVTIIGALALMAAHAPKYTPTVPAPATDVPVTIAAQRAKLKLSDGRTATFLFSVSGGSLACTAAIGLDDVLGYTLAPVGDPVPPPPNPAPTPQPTPAPDPPPAPVTSNLRILFLYDPLGLTGLPGDQQAILTSPALRSYLDKHCPLESGCALGACPLTASKTPSYRFLASSADVSRLAPVWRQTAAAAAGRPVPWMIAVNEAGQTVIDQAWPGSVEETLKLLKKFGGP